MNISEKGSSETFLLDNFDNNFPNKYPGRVVPTNVISTLYPFLSGPINDNKGVYIGHSALYNTENFIDLKSGPLNNNMIVVGAISEGKSFWLKILAKGLILDNMLCVFVDVNGEMKNFTKEVGGIYVDHSGVGGKYIDPLNIPPKIGVEEEDKKRIIFTIEALYTTIKILADDVTPGEENTLDRTVIRLMEKFGIDIDDENTWDFEHQPFFLKDWWEVLCEDTYSDAESLRLKLSKYFEGSKKSLFKIPQQINIPDEYPLITFNLGNVIEGADTRVSTAKMIMTLSYIKDLLRIEKLKGKRYSAVIMDDVQNLMLDKNARKFVNDLATRIRHWNGLIVAATNKPHIFWINKDGSEAETEMWANSSYKIFFWLEESELAAISEKVEIPKEILNYMPNLHATNHFSIRHLGRGWDICKARVPKSEADLYKTRGLSEDGY